MDSRRMRLSVL